MTEEAIQIIIFVFSASAIFLVARKNKWGFVCGLIGQPFWFITTYNSKQWGIFFLSFIYTFNWCYGIVNWFFREPIPKELNKRRKYLKREIQKE